MGWIWRIFGAVIGAFVGVVYALVATSILFLSAHAVTRGVGGDLLLALLYDSVGTAVAGYIVLVTLSYLLAVLLRCVIKRTPRSTLSRGCARGAYEAYPQLPSPEKDLNPEILL
jgi:hypothetical protein